MTQEHTATQAADEPHGNEATQAAEGKTPLAGPENAGDNGGGVQYYTRYSRKPVYPSQAAEDLLERASNRLSFIHKMFETCGLNDDGVTMSDNDAFGLAYILEDIVTDVDDARNFYCGEYRGECWNQPGRDYSRPEVKA